MNLVVIPFHDWKKCEREGFRTRDAHFMQEFGKHPQIDKLLVINRPTSLAETLLLRKQWRVQHGDPINVSENAQLTKVGDKTYTLDVWISDFIQPLLFQRKWAPTAYGRQRVVKEVQNALESLKIAQDYAIFMSAPLYVPLVKQLAPKVFALDAQDNLLKHALYRDVPDLKELYAYCLSQADLLSANSPETTQWFVKERPDSIYIPNGVDPAIFDPNDAYIVPEDIAMIPHPIVGYAGKMQEMFDRDMMMHAASALPHLNFVFIGQQLDKEWVAPLWKLPNVYYLGDKHYTQLPNYLKTFDVCTIPYNQTRQHGVDPIKLYEYLAMQKPVVSTNIGNIKAFENFPQVRIAESTEQFIRSISEFADKIQDGHEIPKYPLPPEVFWHTKADVIVQSILKHLH